jgi:uncharacterized integral membrane protein (TIGR00698 family)
MIRRRGISEGVFLLCLIWCCTPYASPPVALALGIMLALLIGHPFRRYNSKITKYLLQISVVGLGFGMNFGEVVTSGRTGVLFTVVSIFGTLGVGYILGKWLTVNEKTSHLISFGTAICGGSAIAAIAPIINANEEEISVSLGTIFILNSVGLFLFPPAGHYLGLSQHQFGLWSAIAIHDTSSVVGAAVRYGNEALKVATTVKLTRALWILPLSFLAALISRSKSAKGTVPVFIFAFIAASVMTSVVPDLKPAYGAIVRIAKTGLTITLFLIGAGLSREALKSVGIRPIAQGIVLWAFISVVSLIAVRSFL